MAKMGLLYNKYLKQHIIYLVILLILSLFFLHDFISTRYLVGKNDILTYLTFTYHAIKESVWHFHALPFWTYYYDSGIPLLANPQTPFLDLTFFLVLFFPVITAINLTIILHFFIAGLAMYFLVITLRYRPSIAFVSALVYMYNGWLREYLASPPIMSPYAAAPLVLLFVIKATREEKYTPYSILAGLALSYMVFSGGMIILLYSFLILGFFLLFNLIGKGFKKRLFKFVLIGLIISLVTIGVSSVKLIPSLKFNEKSNRAQGVSYEEFIGPEYLRLSEFAPVFLIEGMPSKSHKADIGISASILVLLSLAFIRKKHVIFSFSMAVLSVILATDSPFASFLFSYIPGFNTTRHISRLLFIFVFFSPILVAAGLEFLTSRIKSYQKTVFSIILMLILFELFFIGNRIYTYNGDIMKEDFQKSVDDNQILNYISKDKGIFRIESIDSKELIRSGSIHYGAFLGLQHVITTGGIWFNDYVTFNYIALNYNPLKLWGILNTRYIISANNQSLADLTFVKEFEKCKTCDHPLSDGPYLYKNELYLPRAYFVDNSIMILGEEDVTKKAVYDLLLNEKFDPANATLIHINKDLFTSLDQNIINKFDGILLLQGDLDQEIVSKLQIFVKNGGAILPNIFDKKNGITPDEMNGLLDSLNKNSAKAKEVNISYYSPNKMVIDLNGEEGFLVLSERYNMFPGWKAEINGKEKDIFNANGVVSTVYLNGETGKLVFRYTSEGFKTGAVISSIAALIIIFYFIFYYARNKSKNK